nr:unnamed protein product [Callosobruchus analis]
MSWEHKKIYVTSLMERSETRRKKLQNREIELPTDYVKVTREARLKPAPYEVKYMNHSDFRNYEIRNQMAYHSIRPGEVHHKPEGKIQIKLHFNDELTDLPQRVLKNPGLLPVFDEKLFTE